MFSQNIINEKYTIEVYNNNDEVYFDVLDYLEHSDSITVLGVYETKYLISFITTKEVLTKMEGDMLTYFPNLISIYANTYHINYDEGTNNPETTGSIKKIINGKEIYIKDYVINGLNVIIINEPNN
jgi:hypothetical protein